MPISMFDTRTMLRALEQMMPVGTFLKTTFFSNEETFDTEAVDIDIYKGKRRMAPFVSPRIGGKTMESLGYSTETYKPPLVAPDTITTAEDLLKRLPGESLYSGLSPDQRAATKLGKDLAELDETITRREEWMCAQALFTGKIIMKGEGVDQQIDYNLTNKETLSGIAKWTDAASDPIADLKRIRLEIIKASGLSPDMVIMASDVVDTFINHPKVQNLMDKNKIALGTINPQLLPNGVTFVGTITSLGLDIYSYDEWYLDDETDPENPTLKSMVPEKTILMACKSARFSMLYGAVVDVNRGTFALPRVPKSWTQEKPSARFVQISSRPLPVPHQIDSIYVAVVK